MTCQEFEELSGAYALGATTPEENLAAEAHLAECHRCVLLLRELQDVVDLLPLTVPDATPSPQLRNRILSTIQDEAASYGNQPGKRITCHICQTRRSDRRRRHP